jgi:hypothetical protein
MTKKVKTKESSVQVEESQEVEILKTTIIRKLLIQCELNLEFTEKSNIY